ncbi:Eukaryotic initiation factor 4A-III, partial [Mortierella sp. AD094]
KPAKASGGGGRGRGEEPAKTSGGGWGEKPTNTSGGGVGRRRGEEPAKTSGGGWGEKPAKTSGEGWNEKPVKASGEGWNEEPAKTSGGGWNEEPAKTSGEGWGSPAAVSNLKWGQEIPWEAQNSLKPLSDPDWSKGDFGGDKNPVSGDNSGNSNRRPEGNQPRIGGGRGRPMGDSDSRFSNSQQGYQRGGRRPQGPDNDLPRDARSSLDARNARLGMQRGPRPGTAKTFSDNASASSSDIPLNNTAPESAATVQEPASTAAVESPPVRKDAAKFDRASERRETPFENRRQPSDIRLDPRYNNRQNGPRPGQRGGAFSSQYRQDNHSSSSVSSDVYQNGPPGKGKFDQAGQPRKSPKDRNPKDKVPERYVPLISDSLECQMTWKEMNLSPSVLASIANAGLDKPSNIQKLIMKPFEEGRDVIAQAQSQNDRTNTLAIALLQKLSPSASSQKHCQALVICSEGINPQKVHEDFESWFSSTPGLRSILLSADMVADKTLLSDPEQPKQVVLTTLGPLMEAINNNLLDMKTIGTVVISMRSVELVNFEAFKKFWANLSRDAQVILMTGRIMPQIQMIKMQNFRSNAAVRRADELTMQWSEHYYISVPLPEQRAQLESGHENDADKDSESAPKDRKWEILMDILTKNPDISHSVILTQSQSVTQALTAKLEAQKLPVLSVWSMADKTEVARQFNRPEPCILVSESVLMDNLDLDYSSLVINYEMPRKASHYISSFGPFGRSGLRTLVINFCATEDAIQKQTLGDMESIYDIKIQEMQFMHFMYAV